MRVQVIPLNPTGYIVGAVTPRTYGYRIAYFQAAHELPEEIRSCSFYGDLEAGWPIRVIVRYDRFQAWVAEGGRDAT